MFGILHLDKSHQSRLSARAAVAALTRSRRTAEPGIIRDEAAVEDTWKRIFALLRHPRPWRAALGQGVKPLPLPERRIRRFRTCTPVPPGSLRQSLDRNGSPT
jgi:hypothetical protein